MLTVKQLQWKLSKCKDTDQVVLQWGSREFEVGPVTRLECTAINDCAIVTIYDLSAEPEDDEVVL